MTRAGLAAALVAVGCGAEVADERDQWTVVITTDAPLPQFGDRLLLEVLDDEGGPACAGCRRQIGVPEAWPVSFGIAPPESGGGVRVRARLYRTRMAGRDGLPGSTAAIDALGTAAPPRGNEVVHVHLAMSCFGVPADVEARTTCDPVTGAPVPEPVLREPPDALPSPGDWEGARDVPCAEAPRDDMVCVPGGTFLLGAPAAFAISDDAAPVPERVVRLSPFAIDRDEVTVGAVRALVRADAVEGAPIQRSGDPNALLGACTWLGPDDPSNDALPASCVSHALAQSVCAAQGKRLPTEAEREFVAGNRRLESTYPWGETDDFCARMIAGRGRVFANLSTGNEVSFCRGLDDGVLPSGPVAGGSEADVTIDPPGVRDLGGNLAEWVEDAYAPYTSECWADASLADPVCTIPDPGDAPVRDPKSVRGASWAAEPLGATAHARSGARRTSFDPYLGFRCARSQ